MTYQSTSASRKSVFVITALTSLLAVVPDSYAYNMYGLCNGRPMQAPAVWYGQQLQFTFNTCFYSSIENDLRSGTNEWLSAPGRTVSTVAPFNIVDFSDCSQSVSNFGDGINEITANTIVSGILGLTQVRRRPCSIPYDLQHDGSTIEADVTVDPNTIANIGGYSGPSSCTDNRVSFRLVFAHEFGHVLGLNHQDAVMSIMMNGASTNQQGGEYCNSDQPDPTQNILVAPHADEVAYLQNKMGYSGQMTDFVVSPFGYIGKNPSGTGLTSLWPGVPTICRVPGQALVDTSPGTQFVLNFGNRGTMAASTNIIAFALPCTFGCAAAQSANPSPLLNLGAWVSTVPAQSMFWGFSDTGAVVPFNAQPGVYWVFTWIDFANTIPESGHENNNLSVAATQLVVQASCS